MSGRAKDFYEDISIPNGGVYRNHVPSAERLYVVSSDQEDIELYLNQEGEFYYLNTRTEIVRGEDQSLINFFEVRNNSGGALNMRLQIGTNEIKDNRLELTGSLSSNVAGLVDSRSDVSIPALGQASLKGVTGDRFALEIFNDAPLGTLPMRYGSSACGANNGMKIPAQQGRKIQTTAQVYAYNPNGTAYNMCINEYRK